MHHSNLYKICAYIFNSRRICAQGLYSNFLDYFRMKDPLEMLEDPLGGMIKLKSVLEIIPTYHEVLMMYGPLRRG